MPNKAVRHTGVLTRWLQTVQKKTESKLHGKPRNYDVNGNRDIGPTEVKLSIETELCQQQSPASTQKIENKNKMMMAVNLKRRSDVNSNIRKSKRNRKTSKKFLDQFMFDDYYEGNVGDSTNNVKRDEDSTVKSEKVTMKIENDHVYKYNIISDVNITEEVKSEDIETIKTDPANKNNSITKNDTNGLNKENEILDVEENGKMPSLVKGKPENQLLREELTKETILPKPNHSPSKTDDDYTLNVGSTTFLTSSVKQVMGQSGKSFQKVIINNTSTGSSTEFIKLIPKAGSSKEPVKLAYLSSTGEKTKGGNMVILTPVTIAKENSGHNQLVTHRPKPIIISSQVGKSNMLYSSKINKAIAQHNIPKKEVSTPQKILPKNNEMQDNYKKLIEAGYALAPVTLPGKLQPKPQQNIYTNSQKNTVPFSKNDPKPLNVTTSMHSDKKYILQVQPTQKTAARSKKILTKIVIPVPGTNSNNTKIRSTYRPILLNGSSVPKMTHAQLLKGISQPNFTLVSSNKCTTIQILSDKPNINILPQLKISDESIAQKILEDKSPHKKKKEKLAKSKSMSEIVQEWVQSVIIDDLVQPKASPKRG